jgi:predicted neuraminidase
MKFFDIASALCCFTALLVAGCASPSGSEAAIVKSEFIYDTAPFPSCHASTIEETEHGLIAAFFGGTAERNPDVCIYVSRFENNHWTPPQEVANGLGFSTNRLPTWNPVLFQPKNGPLMLFYKVGPSPSTWWGMLTTSEDGGKTWSTPQRLPENILGPIKNKPVQLANGDILSPSSTEGAGGWRVHFERSSDLGRTWQFIGPVNDGKTIGAIQPSILFHSNNRLQSIGRTRQEKVFEIWSTDGGQTWSEMSLLDLPNPNSGTDAVTLKDGRQLLVYNHNIRTGLHQAEVENNSAVRLGRGADSSSRFTGSGPAKAGSNNKGRSPLNVAVSKDGKEWFAALELENDPDAPNGFAYPAVIQTSDGLVHITYTWERKRIKHVVVDPGKLSLKPITNGQWPR